MIYLFDDKVHRQKDAGWDDKRFSAYSDVLIPIYRYDEIKEDSKRREVFSKGNIVLFHESFFDNILNKHHKDGIEIRNKLNLFSSENKNFYLVFFSGSKNTRNLSGNVGHIPVSILYHNLEVFISHVRNGDINLRYLLYGKNHEIEEVLLHELTNANKRFNDKIIDISPLNRNFIAVTQKEEIEIPFENADCETFYTDDLADNYNNDVDKYCTELIVKWLTFKEYDNIFIPISFGPTLADFNGLRFALHIRCSDNLNRLKNIHLYSFVGYEYLVANEYFDILKTKNVYLIEHTSFAFKKAVNLSYDPLYKSDLPREIKKIKIDPPQNYEDNHSIANEWAIYRWASSIGANDDEIETITQKINNQLYFKYLTTIYPKSEIIKITEADLHIKYKGNPKILYIDDEADKGWYQILCNILYDINNLDFEYLDEELNSKTRDEIFDISLHKIKESDVDLVLLDFRLIQDDFNTDNIKDVTGLRLLNKIKELNHGIQVVIFSATNKIWNLLALQEAGANGFVFKEAPENRFDPLLTKKTIKDFISAIEDSLERVFLKIIHRHLNEIEGRLSLVGEIPENIKFNNFIKKLQKQLVVIFAGVQNIRLDRPVSLDVVFLSCYSFLDLFKKYYLIKGSDHRYYLGFDQEELKRYNIIDGEIIDQGSFIPTAHYDSPGIFHVYSCLVKDYFSVPTIYDINLCIKDFHKIRDYRNQYIHGTKHQFYREELELIINSLLPITYKIRE